MTGRSLLSESFDEETINQVWKKGIAVEENDSNVFRKDKCGAWMQRDKYGDRNHKYGWEIDHIKPKSKGGTDDLSNLRPLHWENNADKSDNLDGYWNCAKSS